MIEGGNNDGKPYEMYVLPSQYMYVLADIQNFPPTISGYQLNYGPLWNFTKQEVLQDKYIYPKRYKFIRKKINGRRYKKS